MQLCGREFSEAEIQWFRRVVELEPKITRKRLSVIFCERTGWRKPDGGLKDMSCRVAMLKMERQGLIELPPPRREHNGRWQKRESHLFEAPDAKITEKAGDFVLRFEQTEKSTLPLWNELVDRFHYLGYKPLPGAQLRYFVQSQHGIVAVLGFSAAAWKTAPRDRHIGWDHEARKNNLHLVVDNSRFLVLPWIRSKNLASRILGMATRRLADDWQARYKYRPVLMESFVQKDKFLGTSYKAANWKCVGETQGRGKLDRNNRRALPVKTVWLYPLVKDFRDQLRGCAP